VASSAACPYRNSLSHLLPLSPWTRERQHFWSSKPQLEPLDSFNQASRSLICAMGEDWAPPRTPNKVSPEPSKSTLSFFLPDHSYTDASPSHSIPPIDLIQYPPRMNSFYLRLEHQTCCARISMSNLKSPSSRRVFQEDHRYVSYIIRRGLSQIHIPHALLCGSSAIVEAYLQH